MYNRPKKFNIHDKDYEIKLEENSTNASNARKGMQTRARRIAEERARLMETQKLTTFCDVCGTGHKGTLGANLKWWEKHRITKVHTRKTAKSR